MKEATVEPRVLINEVEGEGPPLVFLPGGLSGYQGWQPVTDALAQERTTVRIQLINNELGQKGEIGQPGLTLDVERESILMTLDELGIEKPVDMAGWSWGGRAALDIARTHLGRIRSLALVEPAAWWMPLEEIGDEAVGDLERAVALFEKLFGKDVSEDDLIEFIHVAGVLPGDADPRQHPGWPLWVSFRQSLSWASPDFYRDERLSLGDLAAIDRPTLLVRGDRTARWLSAIVDVLAARMPDARLLELPGGHASQLESIEAFVAALREHLARVADG
jgi:pimeloyl-ACP methyl ester carboxylesterase